MLKNNNQKILFLILMLIGYGMVSAQTMSGNYTVNPLEPPSSNNFITITAAISALVTNGVSGPVVVQIAPGSYHEQLDITNIPGTSSINTVTLNGSGVDINYNSSNSSERAVIKLNDADYVMLKNLSVTAMVTNVATYGYGIQFINGSSNNRISHCSIVASRESSSSVIDNYCGILLNSSSSSLSATGNANCNNNIIDSNTIDGGYYGIAILAGGDYTVNSNTIKSNIITNFYRAGIYLEGTIRTEVRANDISRPDIASGLFWGIALYNNNDGCYIDGNRIHTPFGANTSSNSGTYGFYCYNTTAASTPNIYSNNLIYDIRSTGLVTGIELTGNCNDNRFLFNTIYLRDTSSTTFGATKGISINANANGTVIKNNIVDASRTTSGARHGIYISGLPSGLNSDYNDIIMDAPASFIASGIGNNGANQTTLTDWQTATSLDANSVSINPQFTNPATGDFLPTDTALAHAGTGTDVTTDINNNVRSSTKPTMGAFEISNNPLPLSMSNPYGIVNQDKTATIFWSTYSEENIDHFDIEKSSSGADWYAIGSVNSKALSGNSTNTIHYAFNDKNILDNKYYYRVVEYGRAGNKTISTVFALQPKNTYESDISIFPNPTTGIINIKGSMNAAVRIYDQYGRAMQSVTNGNIVDVRQLPDGIYYLVFEGANKRLIFIKQ